MASSGGVGNSRNLATQSIAELIQLHDDVLARLFAIQTLLQDLELISPEQVQRRTDQFRKQFAADLEARLAAIRKKTPAITRFDGPRAIKNHLRRVSKCLLGWLNPTASAIDPRTTPELLS